MTHHKLPPLKHLLKSSFHFYKKNWKKLVGIFVPIEVALFALTLIVIFGFTPVRFAWVGILAALLGIVAMLVQIFKKILIFGGGMIAADIESGEEKSLWVRYKELATQIVPIVWVALLQMLYASFVACATLLLSIAVFFLPFVVLGLLARIFPDITYFISANGGTISICMFIISLVGLVVSNIFFLLKIWFAPYALLIESRDGLDALAESSMLVRGKSRQIFWRILVIGIIVLLPAIIILGPIYAKILLEAAKQMAIAFALGLRPVFPPIAPDLITWRSLFTLIANLICVPIFVALNYFLWKDVKATAGHFEEALYTKTRKWIKVSVWIGLVIAALGIPASIFSR